MADVNGILAATVLSTIAAVAAAAGTTKYMMSDYEERISASRVDAIDARYASKLAFDGLESVRSDLSTYARQMVDVFATDGATAKQLAGIREELDSMQTQMRILSLRVR